MAIAALPTTFPEDDEHELPWPRPALRLVEPTTPAARAPSLRTGQEVSLRRRERTSRRVRRRRVLAGVVLAGVLTLLALPVSALGGHAATSPTVAAPHGGVTYVVRPGDTLWSIASRFDHGGDPRALVRTLAAETGSQVVQPGEHLVVP